MVLDLAQAPQFYVDQVVAAASRGTLEFQRAVSEFYGDSGIVSVRMQYLNGDPDLYGYYTPRVGPYPPKITVGGPSFDSFTDFGDTVIHEFGHQIGYSDPGNIVLPFKGYAYRFASRELAQITARTPWL